jgi:hypothetical protein
VNPIGILDVAALAASAEGGRNHHGDAASGEIGRHFRQPVVLTLRPTIFDRDILALDQACFTEGLCETRRPEQQFRPAICCSDNRSQGRAVAHAPHAATPRGQPCADDSEKFPSSHAYPLGRKDI